MWDTIDSYLIEVTQCTALSHNMITSLRLHVEFQLNEEPHFPFWFTPAQFAGRLIIDRLSEHVEHFELVLPTDKQLNIGTGAIAFTS